VFAAMKKFTRIRYKKEKEGKYSSVETILCNARVGRIVLHINKMKYEIIDINTKEVLAEGIASTLYNLKKSAKDAARNIGANFYDEIRETKTGGKFIIEE
jgi:hypothetical protein